MSRSNQTELSDLTARGLQSKPDQARKLPPHEHGTWEASDDDVAVDQGAIRFFNVHGVIEQVEFVVRNNQRNWVWRTRDGVHEWLDTYTAEPQCPNGNGTGIKTLEAGETYTCSDPECDCRFDRETAREVLSV